MGVCTPSPQLHEIRFLSDIDLLILHLVSVVYKYIPNNDKHLVKSFVYKWMTPSVLQEIFGPVLTVYPYPDDEYLKYAEVASKTSPFALTGALFVKDP